VLDRRDKLPGSVAVPQGVDRRLPSGIARAHQGQRDNQVQSHWAFFRMERANGCESPPPGCASAVGFTPCCDCHLPLGGVLE
jgi:hypothetical protein